MKMPTLKLPEDMIQLQAELTIIMQESLRIAERCDNLLETVLKVDGQTEMSVSYTHLTLPTSG